MFADGFCCFVSNCFVGDMIFVTYAEELSVVLIPKDSTLLSISAVMVHVSHAYMKIDMIRELRSLTLDLKVMFFVIPDGL